MCDTHCFVGEPDLGAQRNAILTRSDQNCMRSVNERASQVVSVNTDFGWSEVHVCCRNGRPDAVPCRRGCGMAAASRQMPPAQVSSHYTLLLVQFSISRAL